MCRALWEQDTPTHTRAAEEPAWEPSFAEIHEDGG